MLYLKAFCFGPFQENTYILYDDKNEAILVDPGNSTSSEDQLLMSFIEEKKLNLKRLLLTHAHIDHILGCRFIYDSYGLLPEVNEHDVFFIEAMMQTADMYGINCEQCPAPQKFVTEGDKITLGSYTLECLFTPGHSPGSISYYNAQNKILLSGDVLFYGSIGRTDLPKGNYDELISSVREKIFTLPDEVKVYSGHGPATTVGFEKRHNPFFT